MRNGFNAILITKNGWVVNDKIIRYMTYYYTNTK